MISGFPCPCGLAAGSALALGERGRGEALPAEALRLIEPLTVPPERYPLALRRARVLARGSAGELLLCEGYTDAVSLFGAPPPDAAGGRRELALLAAYLGPPSISARALAGLGAFAESLATLFYLAALNGKSARLCCRLEGEGEAAAAAAFAARILGDSDGDLPSRVTIRAAAGCARLSPVRGASALQARR